MAEDLDKLTLKQIKALVKKSKSKYSKKIVALVVLLITVYTAAFLYAFMRVGSEPSTLITAFYAWAGYELWQLKDLKKTEIKQQKGEDLRGD